MVFRSPKLDMATWVLVTERFLGSLLDFTVMFREQDKDRLLSNSFEVFICPVTDPSSCFLKIFLVDCFSLFLVGSVDCLFC